MVQQLMISGPVEPHSFEARLECRYLLHVPARIDDSTVLALTLHGYSSNPEAMLRLTHAMLGENHVIASLQAPNEFYRTTAPDSEVGYSWATKAHIGAAVRLHHEMLLHVLRETGERFGIRTRILIGFSQPVGLNYRFAATYPDQVKGVVGICGGIPKDWEEGGYGKVSAALLHIARREDDIFPPDVTEKYPERLRQRAADFEFHMLEGGHRFPSKAGPIAERWLARISHG
jgi:predicted esterase